MSEKNGQDENPSSKGDYRDQKGRFLPGNPGGPGNPQANRVQLLRQALHQAVTPEQIVRGINEVRQIAENKTNSAAIRIKAWALFFERVLGKADQKVEMDPVGDEQIRDSVSRILRLPEVRRALEAAG